MTKSVLVRTIIPAVIEGRKRGKVKKDVILMVGTDTGGETTVTGRYSALGDELARQGVGALTVHCFSGGFVSKSHCTYTDAGWTVSNQASLPLEKFPEQLRAALSEPGKNLMIAVGYPFTDDAVAGVTTEAVMNGLRLLVLDTGIEYKQLISRLPVPGIKHFVRIEKMEPDHLDETEKKLLSVILQDELQRNLSG